MFTSFEAGAGFHMSVRSLGTDRVPSATLTVRAMEILVGRRREVGRAVCAGELDQPLGRDLLAWSFQVGGLSTAALLACVRWARHR